MHNSDYLPALKPAHPDLASCERTLACAAMGDARQACTAYLSLLQDIADAPPPLAACLEIIEALLPRVLAALSELSRRFAGRPLPLAAHDEAAFWLVCDLWQQLLRMYRKLQGGSLQAAAGKPQEVLIAARATTCASELIATYLLARHEVPEEAWQWLHVSYAFAEAHGIADQAPLIGPGQSCSHAYAHALLFALAQPRALSQRDALWARAWARRFASRVRLLRPARAEGMQAYTVDLGGGNEPRWHGTSTFQARTLQDAPLRVLDTSALLLALRKRLRRLEAGEDPAALGLGENCTQPGTGALLRRLLRLWCAGPVAARFPRRAVRDPQASVAAGFAAAHQAISGRRWEEEVRNWHYSRRQFEQLFTFQPAALGDPRQQALAEAVCEPWQAMDESAFGFCLRARNGSRLAYRQLLALRAGGASLWMLAEVRWLEQAADRSVTIGVQVLPGEPRACAARPVPESAARPAPSSPAFLLPEAHGTSASLVLPAGWYRRDRPLELRLEEGTSLIRLSGLLERGEDHDRVSFCVEASPGKS